MKNNGSLFRIVLSAGIIAGFFLPWFDYLGFVSGWDIVRESSGASDTTEKVIAYSFLLIPIFAVIVLARSLAGRNPGFFLRALPFIVTALLSILFAIGEKDEHGTAGLKVFFTILGIGYYLTVIASLLLIFAGGRNKSAA